jgi:hypothetical protein
MVRDGPVGMHAWCLVTLLTEWTVLRVVEGGSQRTQARYVFVQRLSSCDSRYGNWKAEGD